MAFKEQDPIRSKIVTDNKIIEQVNSFSYSGNLISYENEMDIDNKLNNYLKITGIINNVFPPKKSLNKTRIKLYNTLAIPTLLCGSESWTIKARITGGEMRYEQQDTLRQITKIDIIKELNITPVLEKIQHIKRKWI
jgi:hypothetical protein